VTLVQQKQQRVQAECVLVVDIGFSSTTVVPVIAGQAMLKQMRRLDVGGKLLTNYLKELVSHRHWNMLDETFVVNQAKHHLCYVSLDYETELRTEALSFRGPEAKRRAKLRARARARAARDSPGMCKV
jgi:actin-related protein